MKKIPSYTISEMIVTLIVTIVVVGIAFSVLSLVQGHMKDIELNYEDKTELNKFKQSLWIDFYQNEKVSFSAAENEILFMNPIKGEKRYKVLSTAINTTKDTFNLTVKEISAMFEGKLLNRGEIDALNIVIDDKGFERNIWVYKNTVAADYID